MDTVRPRLATLIRLLDIASVLLILEVLAILRWGNWRVDLGALQISTSSWYRVLALALVVGGVRHALVRRPHLGDRLRVWVRRPLVSDAGRAAFSVAAATRVAVLFVGLMATITVGFPKDSGFRTSPIEVRNLPARWDAGWYLDIAINGYWYRADPKRQMNVAFFPAFPYAMRVAGAVMHANVRDTVDFYREHHWKVLYAGVLLSIGAFFWGLIYLYKLATETVDADRARLAIGLMAAYPFAVYYSAPYTEAFFFLSAIGAMYHFRRREWIAAGLWALLIGLTRPNGFLLSAPLGLFAIGFWDARFARIVGVRAQEGPLTWRRAAGPAIVTLLPVAGMLIFSYWMWVFTNRPFVWAQAHGAWGREYGSILKAFGGITFAWEYGFFHYLRSHPMDAMNMAGALLAIGLLIPVAWRFGLGFAAFIGLSVLPAVASGGMLSVGRMTAVCFPMFLYLAHVIPLRHSGGWLGAFGILQGFVAVLFFTWRELF